MFSDLISSTLGLTKSSSRNWNLLPWRERMMPRENRSIQKSTESAELTEDNRYGKLTKPIVFADPKNPMSYYVPLVFAVRFDLPSHPRFGCSFDAAPMIGPLSAGGWKGVV